MGDKNADNRIINTKKEISILEDDLSSNKKSLSELDYLEFNISSIKRNLNECVELINSSVKNKRINNKFQTLADDTNGYYGRTKASFEDERVIITDRITEIKNRINELDESLKKDMEELSEEKDEDKEEIENVSVEEE